MRSSSLVASLLMLAVLTPTADAQKSHPPLRPLPELTNRPLGKGQTHVVDAKEGNDTWPGSERGPWRTINHALKQLKAGDTLLLRGGVYRENVYCAIAGKKDAP